MREWNGGGRMVAVMVGLVGLGVLTACGWVDEAGGRSPSLKVGDPAPPLSVSRWLQGEPVKGFEKGKIYVVEFWATWCPPCRASIPHLNKLHERYRNKGVIIIGQNTGESDEKRVEQFVKNMGTNMTYRVALEEKNESGKGKMSLDWMEAAGQSGIPCAFVVDQAGKIAWIGHPMAGLDRILDQMVAGKFNAEQTAAQQTQLKQLAKRLGGALQQKDWDAALGVLDEMEPLTDADERPALSILRFQVLVRKGDGDRAGAIAAALARDHADRAELLNELAWTLATAPTLSKRDLVLCERIARQANQAAKGEEPAILDTVARILFMKGEKDEAIRLQETAVAKAKDEKIRDDLSKTLESYRKGELPPAGEGGEDED